MQKYFNKKTFFYRNKWFFIEESNLEHILKTRHINQKQKRILKSKYQKLKQTYILNSARSFVNNCPHFQAIMYNKFQQSYNNKDIRIKLLIQFVTMVRLNWYSQTEL